MSGKLHALPLLRLDYPYNILIGSAQHKSKLEINHSKMM